MALESTTFINGLVSSNPASTDSVSQADDHIRLLKATLKNTFPNVEGAVTKTHTQLNNSLDKTGDTMTGPLTLSGAPSSNLHAATKAYVDSLVGGVSAVPSGIISMWSGSIASVPSGWALCDGTSGTPDLRDRFVVGAGSSYAVAATGGSKDAIVVEHNHTSVSTSLSGSVTGISETYNANGSASGVFSKLTGYNQSLTTIDNDSGNTGGFSFNGSHSHDINSTGSSGTNANLPPYYALAYIMKL